MPTMKEILGIEKKPTTPKITSKEIPTIRTIVKKIDVSPEIKSLFLRIHRNLDKTWGLDNNYLKRKEKPHEKPKYRNLWENWLDFKTWFEREVLNQ